jgi:nitroreductase
MDAIECIHTRRSIRKFENRPVADELVTEILRAAMAAPSAGNQQPWHFLVINDRALLDQAAQVHPNAGMAAEAPVAIVVCGDTTRERYKDYWMQDCSAATQNLLLAAHALGLGAVWTGIYPREDRVKGFCKLLKLPETILPHCLVPIGYPAQPSGRVERYDPEKVRYNRW